MTKEEIKGVLERHLLWTQGKTGGERADLREAKLYAAGLRGANLRGGGLRVADLRGADLREANLYKADLYAADLYMADLRGADLYKADLRGADLRGADLRVADLRGAGLHGADLNGADLRGADLRGADLYKADLRGAGLCGAKINWQSHQLVSEILFRAAGRSVARRMVAGLVRVSTDWCWGNLMSLEHPEKEWALDELRQWLQPDEKHAILRPALAESFPAVAPVPDVDVRR